ncbi:MAG: phosphoenolpyruvate carboxykinase (ATP) [Candidatus Marinimicrobia bacterium]|nr:phosphoenolpyruvate carboxykinase (ATP) [Candidatus Neomarinimicrobiota bacterium]
MHNKLEQELTRQDKVLSNIERARLNVLSLEDNEAWGAPCGALVTWHRSDSTGRSPKDTVIVRRQSNDSKVDWNSDYNIPIEPSTFDLLFDDALQLINKKSKVYRTDRWVGADSSWALPITTITDKALYAAFTMNMFREGVMYNGNSIFARKPFYIIVLPDDKLESKKYKSRLRKNPETGETSKMAVAMDFKRRMGIIIGSAYLGSVKKLIFTIYNYYLPHHSILPLHCSANEGKNGDTVLLLGLSGTGKTTLSADPERKLLGDDEHGWSDNGIANFENGCYAKLIDLDPEKEPEIYKATFHQDDVKQQNTIIENAMMYPDGTFDLTDDRLTPNSRASYPLSSLENVKTEPVGDHPKTILFLTADANGVIPPIARLDQNQAMLWFLLGYTSKVPGTETEIQHPKTTFSRFFGAPFMPCNPSQYTTLLGRKMKKYGTDIYLINTGWTNGPYGTGHRIDINKTRVMVNAAINGLLKDVEYEQDPIFKVYIPKSCPGLEDNRILFPKKNWHDKTEFMNRAKKLASEFAEHLENDYKESKITEKVRAVCPGI